MKQLILLLMASALFQSSFAQRRTENLVIVTLDGMRWQEVFNGADPAIIKNKQFTRDSAAVIKEFWSDDAQERRKKLFPFFWTTILEKGRLYGNRSLNCNVDVANPYKFSYPGYNEIFTGYPDTAVNSNDPVENPNENVLEFFNKQEPYQGKVTVFSSWDCFPFILNKTRSRLFVNADKDTLIPSTRQFQLINDMQRLGPQPLGLRPDLLTYFSAREYAKQYHPKVLYIAFDETDDFAHAGMYDQYLKSARAEDAMIADLWTTLQSLPQYHNKTTLIVTCDHGRGDKIKEEWTGHGEKVADAGQIWFVVLSPDIKPGGEIRNSATIYQAQLAQTMAKLLGLDFKTTHPVQPAIKQLF